MVINYLGLNTIQRLALHLCRHNPLLQAHRSSWEWPIHQALLLVKLHERRRRELNTELDITPTHCILRLVYSVLESWQSPGFSDRTSLPLGKRLIALEWACFLTRTLPLHTEQMINQQKLTWTVSETLSCRCMRFLWVLERWRIFFVEMGSDLLADLLFMALRDNDGPTIFRFGFSSRHV